MLRDVLRRLIEGQGASTEARLGATLHLRQLGDLALDVRTQSIGVGAGQLHQRTGSALLLIEDGQEQVLRENFRVSGAGGEAERGLEGFLALGCQSIHLHGASPLGSRQTKSRNTLGKGLTQNA
jgi:hypothetical protein